MKSTTLRPAFPVSKESTVHGITVREYFAAAALTGIMYRAIQPEANEIGHIAARAADDVIAALLSSEPLK